jgi:hypothetical protein
MVKLKTLTWKKKKRITKQDYLSNILLRCMTPCIFVEVLTWDKDHGFRMQINDCMMWKHQNAIHVILMVNIKGTPHHGLPYKLYRFMIKNNNNK